MLNPQTSLWIYFTLCLLVWSYRTIRLLITKTKTSELAPAKPKNYPLVSILIPAKNEERNIRACVESIQKQDYPNTQLIVVNDNSTDRTESILKEMDIPYLNCPLPPEGWTGKNHALYCAAAFAKGEWLLFTDADTRHTPQALSSAIAHAESRGLDFLSLLPHCLTGSFEEELIQPAAMGYLGLWFPFEKVNRADTQLFFANGQFLLIKRNLYESLGGHQAVAKEFLEDFALMRLSKEANAKAECSFGTRLYGTRMYDSLGGIWRGWRRIYLHAFERNPLPLLKNAFSIFFFSVCPFVLLSALLIFGWGNNLFTALWGGLILWILITAAGAHQMVRTRKIFAIFHPLAAFVVVLILLDAAAMAIRKQKTLWR